MQSYLAPDGFDSEAARVLTRTPDVLEHACMCDEGSLIGFDAAGNIELLPNRRSEKQLAEMHAMQDGIVAGVRAINTLLGSLDATPAVGNDDLARQAASIAANAMLYPTIDEAKHIGSWRHEAKVDAMPTMSFSGTTRNPAALLSAAADRVQPTPAPNANAKAILRTVSRRSKL